LEIGRQKTCIRSFLVGIDMSEFEQIATRYGNTRIVRLSPSRIGRSLSSRIHRTGHTDAGWYETWLLRNMSPRRTPQTPEY
jgi:hypothetical protein